MDIQDKEDKVEVSFKFHLSKKVKILILIILIAIVLVIGWICLTKYAGNLFYDYPSPLGPEIPNANFTSPTK